MTTLIERVINGESASVQAQEKDSLSTFVAENGGSSKICQFLRLALKPDELQSCSEDIRKKAESVVRGVEKRASGEGRVMDDQTRTHVTQLATREATFRFLHELFSRASQQKTPSGPLVASPMAEGARFNQLESSTISKLMVSGWAIQPGFIYPSDWKPLCRMDAKRALRRFPNGLEFEPSNHALRYPAVFSMAELISALPRELNLKARTMFCEVETGSYFISTCIDFSSHQKRVLLMALVLDSDSGSSDEFMGSILLATPERIEASVDEAKNLKDELQRFEKCTWLVVSSKCV